MSVRGPDHVRFAGGGGASSGSREVVVAAGAKGFSPPAVSNGLPLEKPPSSGIRLAATALRRSAAALAVLSNGEHLLLPSDAVVDSDRTEMASSSSTASPWVKAPASMSSERNEASDASAAEKLSIVAGDSGCAEIPEPVDRPVTLPMLPWLGVGEWWWWWWWPPRRGEP